MPEEQSVNEVLQVRGLYKSFRETTVLEAAELSLPVNAKIGILGDNGSGKTTLFKCITGELSPDAGEILVDGLPLKKGSPSKARAAGIAFVSQFPEFADQLSALENAFFLNEPSKGSSPSLFDFHQAHALLEEAIDLISPSKIDTTKIISNLSGGQRKAIAVARLMLADPKIGLLDEPTASLGEKQKSKLISYLLSTNAKKRSWIIISHDEDFLRTVCDSLFLICNGKLQNYA